jgi:DNA-directed RNA polymerase specialized sigma24 family protein
MTADERVERLLALILIQGLTTNNDKAIQLDLAGFTNYEIAELIGTTPGTVAQVLYKARSRPRRAAKKPVRKKR